MESKTIKKEDMPIKEDSNDFTDLDSQSKNDEDSVEEKDPEFGPIKRPSSSSDSTNFDINSGMSNKSTYQLNPQDKSSNKKTIILAIILVVVLVAGGYMLIKNRGSFGKKATAPEVVPSTIPTTEPTSTPKPELNKSEWSFEVLNGSGETGLAKKIADKIKDLGYEVTKTGNADKSDYEKTQIFVTKDLVNKVELVIVDLQDVIKIASFGGELKESTPSARIIIGKDSI